MLSRADVIHYREQGWVVAPAVAGAGELEAMRAELDRWIEESRGHDANYGHDTPDGKARFDLEAGHGAERPRLRRVANPADVSTVYRDFLWSEKVVDLVAQLVGPDVKFYDCKLNLKLPGTDTHVGWHQDHVYDPHTNDDMLAALLALDDVSEENGCFWVVPGSHRERYSHKRDGRFVGETAPELDAEFAHRAVPVVCAAGDLCLMHTWTVHGGGPNRSDRPRRILICDYVAADAWPLLPPTVPSRYSGRIVRGKPSPVARLREGEIEMREAYDDDSFFGLQGQKTAAGEDAP